MTDRDPKETEGSGGGDDGGETPPPGKDQEKGYDIREDVKQKVDSLFADFDEDEAAVDVPAEDDAVVDVPAADEAVVNVPATDEGVVDAPADDEAVFELPADEPAPASIPPEFAVDTLSQEADANDTPPPTEAVTPVPSPVTGGKPKKGEGVSPSPENKKPKAPVNAQPPTRNQPASPPAETKPRKSLTSRILVWGAVLIIITVTVRYFVTYSAEEFATAPVGKPGLLFHKIVPVPSPVANRTPAEKSALTPPAEESATTQPVTGTVKAYVPKVYPYAIHIASIKSLEAAKEKLVYYHRGIQAYLVRTDLGKKGVWYRLFFGHFPSATAAVKAIKDNNFTGASVSRTRYTCLMGSYPTLAQAEATTQQLAGKGFLPYTIVIGDIYHVFVGAHPTRAAAESLLTDLSAAGFPAELIER